MMYKIKAIDQLFFRSPAPFETGGGSQLHTSYFPPLPSTYAGAFRSFLPNLKRKEQAKQLKIGFNGLLYQGEVVFPQPLDLLAVTQVKADISPKYYELEKLVMEKAPHSNFPLNHYFIRCSESNEKNKLPEDIYLSQACLKAYLQGEATSLSGFSLSENLTKEPKLGIQIGKNGIVEDGMLYQMEMIRPDKWELVVEIIGVETMDATACIKLGGEGKVVQLERFMEGTENQKFADGLIIKESNEVKKSNHQCFKLYLATPAIFKYGWLPKWLKESEESSAEKKIYIGTFKYKNHHIKIKLIAATIGRFVPVGGFGIDCKNKSKPRPLRYAVPAGSVYYFEILEGDFEVAKKLFHGRCISDFRESFDFDHLYFSRDRLVYCDRGFGHAFVGIVKEEELECMN